MNYDAVKILVDVAQFLLTGGIGVYIYLIKKNDATNSRITKVEKDADERLDDHGRRIATLEGAMRILPTHQDMDALHSRVTELARETSEQTGLLQGLKTQVGLIQEWLHSRIK